ncbi:MAG: class I SAM-dependent methyltransferase [Pseudomonadota bacterium]
MTSLKQLYRLHNGKVSIKWEYYLSEYDRIFSKIRDQPVRILEIGVQNGGSLEIWGKYFEKGEAFIGCDINHRCSMLEYEDDRISVVIGDVNNESIQREIIKKATSFDVVVDDGSHVSSDIIKSFLNYFEYLDVGGIYIIEDMHASYWQEYQGGLYFPYSSMSFFKRMADIINHKSWKTSKSIDKYLEKIFQHLSMSPAVELLASIHSVEFVNSMCIIRKDKAENNELGNIFVAGEDDLITPGCKKSGVNIVFPDQSENPWSNLVEAPDESYESNILKIKRMEISLHECEKLIAHLNRESLNLKFRINAIQNSTSWRLTKPLRYLKRIVSKIHWL